MAIYYVNNKAQDNGDHEVHKSGCDKMPSDRKYLGEHLTCYTAVEEAKKTYPQSNGCKTCSHECNTD